MNFHALGSFQSMRQFGAQLYFSEQKLSASLQCTTNTYNYKHQMSETAGLVEAKTLTTFPLRIAAYLSFIIPILSGKVFPMRQATKQYRLPQTPPGVFFGIWGFIYLNFLVVSTYALLKDKWSRKSWMYYMAWNVLVGFWTYSFTLVTDGGLLIAFLVILALLFCEESLWSDLVVNQRLVGKIGVYTHNAIAVCVGWLVAACNLSFGIVLVQLVGMSYDLQLKLFWALVPISCGVFYYRHYKKAPMVSSIGLVVATVYAIIGAMISTAKPWPRV